MQPDAAREGWFACRALCPGAKRSRTGIRPWVDWRIAGEVGGYSFRHLILKLAKRFTWSSHDRHNRLWTLLDFAMVIWYSSCRSSLPHPSPVPARVCLLGGTLAMPASVVAMVRTMQLRDDISRATFILLEYPLFMKPVNPSEGRAGAGG